MNPQKPSSERNPQQARDQLDALLQKGILADQRATKPPMPLTTPAPVSTPPLAENRPIAPPLPKLQRLTIRFTQSEAQLLEKARGIARSLGYKISDNAVFRLALNAFNLDTLAGQQIESILAADGRRKHL